MLLVLISAAASIPASGAALAAEPQAKKPGAPAALPAPTPEAKTDAPVRSLTLVTLRPADIRLEWIDIVSEEGDGEGEELPPQRLFFLDKKDLFTSMTVTDRRVCVRKEEKAICQAFEAIVDGKLPKLGAEVTGTRIGGAGYVTKFLTVLPGVEYPGVDKVVAFLGSDSQDPPMGNLALYLYARKGTGLVQLTTKVGECPALPKKGESDAAYYRRTCLNEKNVQAAKEKAKELTARFRLLR